MFKLPFIELFLRGIPEGLLCISCCYVLSRTKMNWRRIIIASIIMAICVYGIRMLPIRFYHISTLSICTLTFINIIINKIPIIKSIQVSIYTFIIEILCEWINFLALKVLFSISPEQILISTLSKMIYGSPSLVMFVAIILLINYIMNRISNRKNLLNERRDIFKY